MLAWSGDESFEHDRSGNDLGMRISRVVETHQQIIGFRIYVVSVVSLNNKRSRFRSMTNHGLHDFHQDVNEFAKNHRRGRSTQNVRAGTHQNPMSLGLAFVVDRSSTKLRYQINND